MAQDTPLASPGKPDLKMPLPPPLLHTRSGNELYDRPNTPKQNGFTSPLQTPQGSPSKKHLPPGANDLPNVFDNAMKLGVMSPTKKQAGSPSKQVLSAADDNANNSNPFSEVSFKMAAPEARRGRAIKRILHLAASNLAKTQAYSRTQRQFQDKSSTNTLTVERHNRELHVD